MSLNIGLIRKKITPKIGTLLAGYDADVVSVGVNDDLYISGISFDDGSKKAILLSYDLLGLDEEIVTEIRSKCAIATGINAQDIILTCTHTHSGPHTRRNLIADLDHDYVRKIIKWSVESVTNAFKNMQPATVYHYSAKCYENVNRRILFPDNSCEMLSKLKHLEPLADNITDPELGILYFVSEIDNKKVVATLVNYAAHPLSCQTGGISSRKITSDYPGFVRGYVENELGGTCIFTSGACGDLHPRGFCKGTARTAEMGTSIGIKIAEHFFDVLRNPDMCKIENPTINTDSAFFEADFRENKEKAKLYGDRKSISLELQFLTIGEICFVGVPGELLTEPGLEIKWHSPFKKTFILYNSTAYISYIPQANAYLQGGYESETSLLAPTASFKLVAAAIENLNKKTSIPNS
jgi:neutral/alkaline ceramidase-like enzyme